MTLTKQDLTAVTSILQTETKKIVQSETRKVVNGQSAMKSELLGEIKKVNTRLDNLEKKMNDGFKNVKTEFEKVNGRIDKLGLQLANLEDDAPTIEEFDKLEKRVSKIEQNLASV